MKHLIRRVVVLCMCTMSVFASSAQNNSSALTITASFENQPISEILSSLESQYPVAFYYRPDVMPAEPISVTLEEATVDAAVADILRSTILGHVVYRDYVVLIAPRYVIGETYSADYYKALEQSLSENPEDAEDTQIVIGEISRLSGSGETRVIGTLTDAENGEPVIGANVSWPGQQMGTVTDVDGKFETVLPVGQHTLLIKYIGYEDLIREVKTFSDGEIALELKKSSVQLDEVTIKADAADAGVETAQIGVATLDIQNIKKLPSFFGEADIVKSLLLHPGVSTIGEGASGFNVRGGDVDQNLIMQDKGFFMNSSHALGFFSAFNSDMIGRVDLYKGNIPAEYGGRLASVMNIEMRDGNFGKFLMKGGIGPVSSRLSMEGPVVSDKVSFIAGGRVSHADWLLRQMNVLEVQNSSAFFYDVNARLTTRINDKNTLILAGYASSDKFDFNKEFGFEYETTMAQATYKTIFSDKAYSNLSFTLSEFNSTQKDFDGNDASQLDNKVSYFKANEKLTFNPSSALRLDGGVSAIWYDVNPGERRPLGVISLITTETLESEKALEAAAFVSAEYEVATPLLITGGIRFAQYQFLGPKTYFTYEDPDMPAFSEIVDTISAGSGSIASYSSLEPRLSFRYRLSPNSSIKAGYSRTAQFINQIFNSDSPTPTSQWQLSTEYIKPTRSHNFSLGYFKNMQDNLWETSFEVYYRSIDELYDYRDFADLVVNPHLETELLAGIGRTYGAEFSVRKKEGVLNGWLSYTWSKSERLIEGINKGDWYPSNFDKTHVGNFILNYQPNRRNTLTLNFSFSTGRPTSPPVGSFATTEGLIVPVYSRRNQLRIPDYHRLDLAYTLGKGYKRDQKIQTSWTISLYNVYGRKNAFSVFFTQAPFGLAQANKLSILGSAFPAITLNFEIL